MYQRHQKNIFPVLFVLFTVVPVVEIILLFRLAGMIGGWATFFVVIITGIVGASLARAQGVACVNRIQAELSRGKVPTVEMGGGLLLLIAAVLLVTPGILTDMVGFLLLVPAFRKFVVHYVLLYFKGKVVSKVSYTDFSGVNVQTDREYKSTNEDKIVDEIIDVDAEVVDDEDDEK